MLPLNNRAPMPLTPKASVRHRLLHRVLRLLPRKAHRLLHKVLLLLQQSKNPITYKERCVNIYWHTFLLVYSLLLFAILLVAWKKNARLASLLFDYTKDVTIQPSSLFA